MTTNTLMRTLVDRPWLAVAAVSVAQAVALYVLAEQTALCCDSVGYYLAAGESLWRDGLLWKDDYAGYRFYLTPLVFGFLERISHALAPSRSVVETMPFLLCIQFAITSSAASIFVYRRDGIRRWALFAIPMLLNPLVLTIAPYPLQESVIVAGCLPLLLVLLAHRFDSVVRQCFVAGLCIAIATMTRPTLVWIAIPILIHVFYPIVSARRWDKRSALGAAVLTFVIAAAFTPQAYIHWNTFHSLSPVPHTAIEERQIGYGVDMLEYGTVRDGAAFPGLPVYSPYHRLPDTEKKLSFYVDHPAEGMFLAPIHSWSAFDFVSFRPYMPRSAIGIVNVTLLASALITALGLLAIWRMIADAAQRALGLTLGLTVLLNCVYVAASATENRFGLLGFIALTVAAWQTLSMPEGRKLYVRTAPLVVAYLCLCLIINALLYYRSGWLWPDNPS